MCNKSEGLYPRHLSLRIPWGLGTNSGFLLFCTFKVVSSARNSKQPGQLLPFASSFLNGWLSISLHRGYLNTEVVRISWAFMGLRGNWLQIMKSKVGCISPYLRLLRYKRRGCWTHNYPWDRFLLFFLSISSWALACPIRPLQWHPSSGSACSTTPLPPRACDTIRQCPAAFWELTLSWVFFPPIASTCPPREELSNSVTGGYYCRPS